MTDAIHVANLFNVYASEELVQIECFNELGANKRFVGGVAFSRTDACALRDTLVKLLGPTSDAPPKGMN